MWVAGGAATLTGCTKHPNFGVPGSKKKEFCSEHQTDGMVNVVSRRCGHPGCTKRPSFGVAGSKKREFCSEHKKGGMVDVHSRRCGHIGCTTHPSYGVASSGTTRYCLQHAEEGMINLRGAKTRSLGGGGTSVEEHGRCDSAVGAGRTIHNASANEKRRKHSPPSSAREEISSGSIMQANKRARQVSASMHVAPSPVQSEEGETAEDGLFPESRAAAVKMEPGLFEGRPRGSFQSRRSRSSSRR